MKVDMNLVLKLAPKSKEKVVECAKKELKYNPIMDFLEFVSKNLIKFEMDVNGWTIWNFYSRCVETYEGITGRDIPISDKTFCEMVADKELLLALE